MPTADLILRQPRLEDGAQVHQLVHRNPPLDGNSAYAYFLLCSHFAPTCVVAEKAGRIVGFLSAYRQPHDPKQLFVWQMAVDAALRGQGLAGRMLRSLLACPACTGVAMLSTTISPSNLASRQVFERLGKELGVAVLAQPWLAGDQLGQGHEDEHLITLGPIPSEH